MECPVCLDKEVEIIVECNHGYCISCISRIKKCCLCRKPLLRHKLCNNLKQWFNNKGLQHSDNTLFNTVTKVYSNNIVSVFAYSYE